MSPTPRCLIDPTRPCGACIAPSPAECPYAYLLADEQALHRRYGHPAPDRASGPAAGSLRRATPAPHDGTGDDFRDGRDFRPVRGDVLVADDRCMPPPVSVEILDRDEAVALLGGQGVCRVVFTVDALPAVLPVNYAVDSGVIVLSTRTGARLASAADGGVLAVQVDDLDRESRTGWSVVVTGVAEVLAHGATWSRVRGLLDQWVPERDDIVIRVPMTVVAGRRLVAEIAGSR